MHRVHALVVMAAGLASSFVGFIRDPGFGRQAAELSRDSAGGGPGRSRAGSTNRRVQREAKKRRNKARHRAACR